MNYAKLYKKLGDLLENMLSLPKKITNRCKVLYLINLVLEIKIKKTLELIFGP
jgi:hypothetical protein